MGGHWVGEGVQKNLKQIWAYPLSLSPTSVYSFFPLLIMEENVCNTLQQCRPLFFGAPPRARTYICPLSVGSMCVNIKAGVLPQRKKGKRPLAKVDARLRFFLTMVFAQAQKNFKFVEKYCRPKLGPRVHHKFVEKYCRPKFGPRFHHDAFSFLSLFAGSGGQPISKVDNPLHITTQRRVPESGESQI